MKVGLLLVLFVAGSQSQRVDDISAWWHSIDQNSTRILSRRLSAFGTAMSLFDTKVPAVRVEWSRSFDSVGFYRNSDPKHEKDARCIHPAPFGAQCTTHRVDALVSCLALGCEALICPDQRPYTKGQPAKHIKGAICQVRNHADLNERRHGMCRPSGCTRWIVQRGTLGSFLDTSALAMTLSASDPNLSAATPMLAVILPGRLLQYECRNQEPSHGTTEIDSSFCGCIDLGALGRVIMQKPLSSEQSLLCIVGR